MNEPLTKYAFQWCHMCLWILPTFRCFSCAQFYRCAACQHFVCLDSKNTLSKSMLNVRIHPCLPVSSHVLPVSPVRILQALPEGRQRSSVPRGADKEGECRAWRCKTQTWCYWKEAVDDIMDGQWKLLLNAEIICSINNHSADIIIFNV